MTITPSSILLSLLEAGFLILILELIFSPFGSKRFLRADFLVLMMGMTVLRLCFPVEFFCTIPVQLPWILNPLVKLLQSTPIEDLSVGFLLSILCLAGTFWYFVQYIRLFRRTENAAARIRQNAEKTSVRRLLHDQGLPDFPVYLSASISSPLILGRNRSILLPAQEFTREQLSEILRHEIRHLENHDFLKRQGIELLAILYWWFPPVRRLRRVLTLYTEITADAEAVWNESEFGIMQYAAHLLDLQKQLQPAEKANRSRSSFSSLFLSDGISSLTWRIQCLLDQKFSRKTSGFCLMVSVVCLFCFCFAGIKPVFSPPADSYTWTPADVRRKGVLISHLDGRWSLQMGPEVLEVTDPYSPLLTGVPVKYE